MKTLVFPALLITLLLSCKKDSGSETPERQDPPIQQDIPAVDFALKSFMDTYSIPGASIAVVKEGKLVYVKSYGTVGKTDNTVLTNGHLFRVASVSKPITAVGIMKLLEAGKLKMNSRVFGPESILGADYPEAPAGTHDITVEHLLQHTVGAWGNNSLDPMFQQPTLSHKELIKWTLARYPATTNRGNHVYSNFGYALLGRVIEKLSGKTYEQFIKDEVLKPAGVTNMAIGGNTLAQRKPNEVIYTGQGGFDPYLYNITRMDSHGGWIGSATDLARFIVSVDGFNSKPDILKPETIKIMATRSVPSSNYANGWGVNNNNHWWHMGSLPGTAAEIIRASSGFSWVVLTNSRSYTNGFDSALDNLFWPIVNNPSTPWQNIDQF